jgi:hypothetical protein
MSPNHGKPHWNISVSNFAKMTVNPHRMIAENLKIIPNPNKKLITLQMGDPTLGPFQRPIEVC